MNRTAHCELTREEIAAEMARPWPEVDMAAWVAEQDARITPALAQHGYGLDRAGRWFPLTRITLARSWADGGEWLLNRDGHLPEGVIASHGQRFGLTLIAMQTTDAALHARFNPRQQAA